MRTYWNAECRDASGNLKWAEEEIPNILHDQGGEAILSAYFATAQAGFGAPPASLYLLLRLSSDTPADGDTLASGVNEVSGTGYARIAVSTSTEFTLSQVTDWRATSASKVFTAGGTWTAAGYLALCTVSSGTAGKLIASAALSTARTLVTGDTLTVSLYVSLGD